MHDLDTVVEAIAAQPAMARFVATTVAGELLGATPDDLVDDLATGFAATGFDVRSLVRSTLQAGLAGASVPIVVGPVAWLVWARRVTGAQLTGQQPARQLALLRAAGQLPMSPPNVAGWPGGAAWFASASVVARCNLAGLVARATSDGPVLDAARSADPRGLAVALALPSAGFGPATAGALAAAAPGVERLTLALAAPETFVV